MKRTTIGEFEELVLLTVGILYHEAYGLSITDELEKRSGRPVMISAVHKTLVRLEKKGLISSSIGESTAKRGGRSKKLYLLTDTGKEVLEHSRALRNQMWDAIPKSIWN